MQTTEIAVFWFRRDLRLEDNAGLSAALRSGLPVLPVFIFDDDILSSLAKDDPRVTFIYQCLEKIHLQLSENNSGLSVRKGTPLNVWKELLQEYSIKKVFLNKDYEPYAKERDRSITKLLQAHKIDVYTFKDQVIFEESEVMKDDGDPYVVYTPYKNKWLEHFKDSNFSLADFSLNRSNFLTHAVQFPEMKEIGFERSRIKVKPYDLGEVKSYGETRDFPAKDTTSYVSPHLRFGTVSVRKMVLKAQKLNAVFLSELIWREFFMQILHHFPTVVTENFRKKYDGIRWRNNEEEFEFWKQGKTGYPIVDAGMRQLNETGYMHNRIRMVTASFLCKHLLIDWRWGEAYFAEKLLDYELSSNNGNWQWVAGTGCDASPYFRIF